MQNNYRILQSNNCLVNPVIESNKGFIVDGKILHCELF